MKHIVFLLAALIGSPAAFCQTTAANPAAPELWNSAQVPLSFVDSGVDSSRPLPAWKITEESVSPEVRRYIYTDPQTQLKVTAEVRTYSAFRGVTDWVLRFHNNGPTDTPILEKTSALHWTIPASGDLLVRHARGSGAHANDFEPLDEHIRPGENDQIESIADPSSRISLPFFNLQTGDHGTTAVPYTTPESLYLMRLGYNSGYGLGLGEAGLNNDRWVSWIKQAIAEYREVQPYFYADFYPLLRNSLAPETRTAWQWDFPQDKQGLVMVLRRPLSPFTTLDLGLQGLHPEASYEVEIRVAYDHAPVTRMQGGKLARLHIRLDTAPSSALIFYRELPQL